MPAKKKSVVDPVFGKLTFDVLWEGRMDIPSLGKIEVSVDGGNSGNPPTEEQRTAASNLVDGMPGLLHAIHEAIFTYYRDHRKKYLALAVDEDDVPELASAAEIQKVLEGRPQLSVEFHRRGKAPVLTLAWGTTFDDEHGISVELIDGRIRNVGP